MVGAEVGDPVAAANPEAAQAVGQPGDPVMQLRVGHHVLAVHDRHPLRGPAGAPGYPRAHAVVAQPRHPFQPVTRPSSLAALCFKIFSLTSGLMSSFAKSASQRSGVSSGKSEPNSTLSASSEFAYCTRIGGKYFGDHPDRSM